MFELIKLLSLYKTNTKYIAFTKFAGTVKEGTQFFIDSLKLFQLFSVFILPEQRPKS